jgi:hypothetical protein
MAWGSSPVVSHSEGFGAGTGGTTSGIDTTGADTIFVEVAHQSALTPSDSKSNTWTLIRNHDNGFGVQNSLYRLGSGNASVGSGHTFTLTVVSGPCSVAITAFAGGATSSIDDQENSAGGIFDVTIQPGSITPSGANTLLITGCTFSEDNNEPSSIDGGFTIAASSGTVAGQFGTGIAYLVQGSAAAANPTWTATVSATHRVATIANFVAAAGGGGGTSVPKFMQAYRRRRAV